MTDPLPFLKIKRSLYAHLILYLFRNRLVTMCGSAGERWKYTLNRESDGWLIRQTIGED